ncbi:MAG TPA: TonB-dependent receptor [Rhizomicrobium sp.]
MHANRLVACAAAALTIATAQADDAPSAILNYDPAFFAEARPNTAFDMVGRLPGFVFTDIGSARGFAGNAGNVLINDQRPTSKADSLQSILQRIPAKDVERIALIRGGAPGIDMQGQTVIADVILKKADSTTWVATAQDHVFKDGHMVPDASLSFTRHAGGAIYEGTIQSTAGYDDSAGRGFHDLFDGAGHLLTHDTTYSHGDGFGLSAKGAATLPLWGGEFKANLTLTDSPFNDSLLYRHTGFSELFQDNSREKMGELGLHWKGAVGGAELETLVLQRIDDSNGMSRSDDMATTQLFTSSDQTGESIARATLRYLPIPALTLEGGGEGAFNFLDGKTAFFVNGANQPLPSADARVEERRGEAFGQADWRFAEGWMIEAGLRAEYSTIGETGAVSLSRSFFYPKPRAVLTWTPDKDSQLRLRYEKIVGQLDFNNFVASADLAATGVTAGNENLRPDQRTQYEISYERHFWGKGAFVLTYMHEQIKDVVDFVPIVTPTAIFDAPGNIGDGRNEEIHVEVTLPLDRFLVPGGLLTVVGVFDLSRVRDPVTGLERVISGQRPQNLNASFSQDIDSLKSTWGINYYNGWDERYYRLDQFRHRKVPPPYLSLFWEYKPSPAWSFHVEANNIVPFVFTDIRYNYAGPRNSSPLDNIEENVAHSNPAFQFQIRWTI